MQAPVRGLPQELQQLLQGCCAVGPRQEGVAGGLREVQRLEGELQGYQHTGHLEKGGGQEPAGSQSAQDTRTHVKQQHGQYVVNLNGYAGTASRNIGCTHCRAARSLQKLPRESDVDPSCLLPPAAWPTTSSLPAGSLASRQHTVPHCDLCSSLLNVKLSADLVQGSSTCRTAAGGLPTPLPDPAANENATAQYELAQESFDLLTVAMQDPCRH